MIISANYQEKVQNNVKLYVNYYLYGRIDCPTGVFRSWNDLSCQLFVFLKI